MQTTLNDKSTQQTIDEAKAEFLRAKDQIAKDLATTPDDKINWSPSATARTPVQLVAHAAMSIAGIQDWLSGKEFPWASMTEADAEWRKAEKAFTTREQVNELLEKNSEGYVAWLDALTPEFLATDFQMGMRPVPMTVAITFVADHLRCHAGQLEYLQTIYGDLDWHMG